MRQFTTVRVLLLILLVGCVSMLAGCGDDSFDYSEYNFYEDKDAGFSLYFPKTWKQMTGMGTLVSLISDDGKTNATVTTENLPYAMSPDDYMDRSEEQMRVMLPGSKLLFREPATVNGVDGIRYGYDVSMSGIDLTLLGYALVKDKKVFVVTCGTLAEDYSANEETFEIICNSFEFL